MWRVSANRSIALDTGRRGPAPVRLVVMATTQTAFVASRDRTRIAYDITGTGPALFLLHGGGQSRRVWHDHGYVDRLKARFTVVAVDLRGNGESDKPTAPDSYRIDRQVEDLLAVADAIGAPRFSLWGYSYGGNVGRYLAVRPDRLDAFALIGIPFGEAVGGAFRQLIVDRRAKWLPVIDADRDGRLDLQTLSEADRDVWQRGTVAVALSIGSAMLEWPPIEPSELACRTLWLVGSANAAAMESVRLHEHALNSTRVTLDIVDGLTHEQELLEIDRVLPRLEAFTLEH